MRTFRRISAAFIGYSLVGGVLLTGPEVSAQEAVRLHIVSGTVRDENGNPIGTATVAARSVDNDSAQRAIAVTSDSTGRYVFRWTGSTVLVTVSRIGFIPAARLVQLDSATRDAVHFDIRLNSLASASIPATTLPTVVTSARRRPNENRRLTAGENRSGSFVSTLDARSVTPGNLTEMAARAPGVMRVGNGDDGPAAVSIAGQPSSQNHTLIDGASSQNGTLPSEGMASASVVLSAYDVSIGQFTGGELRATTRAGTNTWGGALRTSATPGALAYGVGAAAARRPAPTTLRFDGGGGGPLKMDRLFGYAAFSFSRRTVPTRFFDGGGAALLGGGPSVDSILQRFPAVLRQIGVPITTSPSSNSTATNFSGITRFDWAAGDHNLYTLRFDGRTFQTAHGGASPTALSAGALATRTINLGVLAAWSARYASIQQELKISTSTADRRVTNAAIGPPIAVTVLLPESDVGIATLRLGGNPLGFDRQHEPFSEFSDELTWLSAGSSHEWKLGLIANDNRSAITRRTVARGALSYASLDDLAANRPSWYTRSSATSLSASAQYGALYIGDTWSPVEAWKITYGVRSEVSRYAAASRTRSTLVAANDFSTPPLDWGWLPRLGSSYYGRVVTVDGGIGLFRGSIRAATLSNAAGDAVNGSQVECVGAAVPSVDLANLYSHPDNAPVTCAPGNHGFSSAQPNATVFARNFGAPRSARASLNMNWQFRSLAFLHFRSTLANGYHEPTVVDRNFNSRVRFALANEDARPVFVAPEFINGVDGSVSSVNARVDSTAGRTLRLGSDGHSRAAQLSLGVEIQPSSRSVATVWYTHSSVRDETSGFSALGGSSASTAGDPRVRDRGSPDFVSTHLAQLDFSERFARRINLTVLASVMSGVQFTPMVAGDINGDGLDNDRAFVFDPANTRNVQMADAMSQLLRTAPPAARHCLDSQRGRIAARASCSTAWSPFLDAQLNFGPHQIGNHALTVVLSVQNITSGLDYALHGTAHLRGWGQLPLADNRLLQRTGFDAQSKQFLYAVNPSFGSVGMIRAGHAPLTVSLQVRVALADPARQLFGSIVSAALSGRASTSGIQRFLATRFPDVAGRTLSSLRSWSLDLSGRQTTAVADAADSIGAPLRLIVDSLQHLLAQRGGVSAKDGETLRSLAARAEALAEAGRLEVKRVLTERQWLLLPVGLRASQVGKSVQVPMTVNIPTP